MSIERGNDEQRELWGGKRGQAWVESQALIEDLFRPIQALLVEAAAAAGARTVLDVGCGTGGTTLAIARRIGAGGRAVGVDLSEPMIAAARGRAERAGAAATFVRADAQTHAFEARSFDALVSRFGVMFFADSVRAFANLRAAAADGAALANVVWRSAADNPFMTTAERAAAPLLPALPPRDPDAPGQFAFADRAKVERILTDAGWSDVAISALDVPCAFPAAKLVEYFTRLGPVGAALADVDPATHARVVDTVRAAFDPYVHGAVVRFNAACWLVEARASRHVRGAGAPA